MLARKVKRKAESIFKVVLPIGVKIVNKSKPIFAASRVPAVVGDTNLFCVICCMITPETLIPTPAKIRAAVRGNRLIEINSIFSISQFNKSAKTISATPTKRDTIDSAINIKVRTRALKFQHFNMIANIRNKKTDKCFTGLDVCGLAI